MGYSNELRAAEIAATRPTPLPGLPYLGESRKISRCGGVGQAKIQINIKGETQLHSLDLRREWRHGSLIDPLRLVDKVMFIVGVWDV